MTKDERQVGAAFMRVITCLSDLVLTAEQRKVLNYLLLTQLWAETVTWDKLGTQFRGEGEGI